MRSGVQVSLSLLNNQPLTGIYPVGGFLFATQFAKHIDRIDLLELTGVRSPIFSINLNEPLTFSPWTSMKFLKPPKDLLEKPMPLTTCSQSGLTTPNQCYVPVIKLCESNSILLARGGQCFRFFQGVDKVINKSQAAFDSKKYNLSAKLISYVLAVEPDNKQARQIKANALRQMAYTTRSGIQTRDFLLTNALHLEGKIDMNQAPKFLAFGSVSTNSIMASVPGSSIKQLETLVDPEKCKGLNEVIELTFSDLQKTWDIHVRSGVVEVSESLISNPSIKLKVSRLLWAELISGSLTLEEFTSNNLVEIQGDQNNFKAAFSSFDNIKN